MGKHIKILIVEDEILVAADIKHQLMQHSNRTVLDPVTKGEIAIEVAKTERPDIILMDIILGTKINGLEVAREILNVYNPFIIFVSGYIDDKISNEIDSFNAFKLMKPYNIRDINKLIQTVFPSPSRWS
jgi:DNA-binding NarL/FixJ family response regulator